MDEAGDTCSARSAGLETALEAIIDSADLVFSDAGTEELRTHTATEHVIEVEESCAHSEECGAVNVPRAVTPPRQTQLWQYFWAELEQQGWRIELGPKGDEQQEYYLPPGVRRGHGARNRVDYFDSKMGVMRHVRESECTGVRREHKRSRCVPVLPLSGWRVTASGFDVQEARTLQRQVERLGGQWFDQQESQAASLVVMNPVNARSGKLLARVLGIGAVYPRWLGVTETQGTPALDLPAAPPWRIPWTGRMCVRGSEVFKATWKPVLRAAGAALVEEDARCRGCLVLAEDAAAAAAAAARAVGVVDLEWLEACLICQKLSAGVLDVGN